uniref:Intraflagellar transport 20 n=1 Tax=Gallus gallus TaxID=9031 RepID=A0A8V1AKU1_CHICK
MAQAALGSAGLHFDELNKLRVLDPDVAQQTAQLREECKAFVDKIVEFQKTVGSLIELVDQLAKAAESEKMKVPCRYGLSCLPLLAVCVCEKPPVPSCHSTAALSASYGHSRGPICVQYTE